MPRDPRFDFLRDVVAVEKGAIAGVTTWFKNELEAPGKAIRAAKKATDASLAKSNEDYRSSHDR